MTVGLSDVYCKLQQICHFCVTNLSFKHEVKIKILVVVSNFPLLITFINACVFVESNSSIFATIQNYTNIHLNLVLTVADSITY